MSASAPTARFPRRPTRGVMLGLSGLRLASVSLAVVILLFWLLTIGGALGFGVGVLLASPLVSELVRRRRGPDGCRMGTVGRPVGGT